MTKTEIMAMVKDLMEKSGDLAIAATNGEDTSGAEWSRYCSYTALETAIETLTEAK